VFGQLLLLAIVLLAITLVRLLRGGEAVGRAHLLWVGFLLFFSAGAVVEDDRFVGLVCVGLTVASVIVPWLLEIAVRAAFGTGRLRLGVMLSSWRAILMPGAGLGAQLPLLRGLAVLEREGVDAAVAYFRALASATEDEEDLELIDEQIVSMLLYGERWTEGIEHYERRFRPRYAVHRPPLALGLVRAYGEAGRMDRAAGLLRWMEESPLAGDPHAAEVLGQARLTFLAFAGASRAVAWVADHSRFEDLGLSDIVGTYFQGVALARAGDSTAAQDTFRRVTDLASSQDDRLSAAATRHLDGLRAGTRGFGEVQLEPELRSYAQGVAQRLMGFLRAAPGLRLQGRRSWTTYLVMALVAGSYVTVAQLGGGGPGLVKLGALTSETLAAGAWERLFVAPWLQHDLLAALASVYAVWLGGQLVERVFGAARLWLLVLLPPVVGAAAGVWMTPHLTLPSTASLLTCGILVGGLWTLLPSRTPALAPRARRSLAVTLTALSFVTLLMVMPAALGSSLSPVALLGTVGAASVITLAGRGLLERDGKSEGFAWALVLILFIGEGVAFARVATIERDQLGLESQQQCEALGLRFDLPSRFEVSLADPQELYGMPIYAGLIDRLELDARAAGGVVQLLVADPPGDGDRLALFGRDAQLGRRIGVTDVSAEELSPDEFIPEAGWRMADLRVNGRVAARVVERPVLPKGASEGDAPVAHAVLIAAPAEALNHAPRLYASALAGAVYDPEANQSLQVRCHAKK
jgi:membrane associated rhomboid family serine protease